MERSTMIAAVSVFILVGGFAGGCRRPAAPTRPAPPTNRAPPGPPDGGVMVPDSEPAEPSPTGKSDDQGAEGRGQ